jgi:hypothetical protein
MGALDDAIREHLDLKRRQGASEEELKRKEDEAFGHAPLGSLAAAQAPKPEAPAPEDAGPEAAPESAAEPDPAEAGRAAESAPPVEPPVAAPEDVELPEERSLAETGLEPDELLPDEVLPDEALEPERENGAVADDLLEETPDFLDQETPDQDRLWFERKPPKDFDFDS